MISPLGCSRTDYQLGMIELEVTFNFCLVIYFSGAIEVNRFDLITQMYR